MEGRNSIGSRQYELSKSNILLQSITNTSHFTVVDSSLKHNAQMFPLLAALGTFASI